MWKQLRALFPSAKPKQLTINGHGQESCGIPFEQITDIMKWLGLSLMNASYEAKAHIIWDSPETEAELGAVLKDLSRRDEPTFLYRCGDRPMQPPTGFYWRLMPEYSTLRMYQLELTEQ